MMNSDSLECKELFRMAFDTSVNCFILAFCVSTLNSSHVWLAIFWG